MKKYILISRGIIIFPAVALVMLAANAKVSDFRSGSVQMIALLLKEEIKTV